MVHALHENSSQTEIMWTSSYSRLFVAYLHVCLTACLATCTDAYLTAGATDYLSALISDCFLFTLLSPYCLKADNLSVWLSVFLHNRHFFSRESILGLDFFNIVISYYEACNYYSACICSGGVLGLIQILVNKINSSNFSREALWNDREPLWNGREALQSGREALRSGREAIRSSREVLINGREQQTGCVKYTTKTEVKTW